MGIIKKSSGFLLLFIFIYTISSCASLYTLEDSFEDNENNWSLNCTEFVEKKIENGKYIIMSYRKNWSFWSFAPVPEMIEQYSIEADMELLKGRGRYGFIFNFYNIDNYCMVNINPAFQCYRVLRSDGGETQKIRDWTHREDIINKNKNHLKIVQTSSQAEIYINEELVTTVTVPVHLNGVKNGLLISTMKEDDFLPVYTAYDNFKIKGIVRD